MLSPDHAGADSRWVWGQRLDLPDRERESTPPPEHWTLLHRACPHSVCVAARRRRRAAPRCWRPLTSTWSSSPAWRRPSLTSRWSWNQRLWRCWKPVSNFACPASSWRRAKPRESPAGQVRNQPAQSLKHSLFHRDEDMQSLASLMSFKHSDVGNLEDFYDSDEEVGEERKSNHGSGHVAGKTGAPSLARVAAGSQPVPYSWSEPRNAKVQIISVVLLFIGWVQSGRYTRRTVPGSDEMTGHQAPGWRYRTRNSLAAAVMSSWA